MKKLFVVLLAMMIVSVTSIELRAHDSDEVTESANTFIQAMSVEDDHSIRDFETIAATNGETHFLVNLAPTGYLILNDDYDVVEASFWSKSPYEEYGDSTDKYYGGPMNYLVLKDGVLHHIDLDEQEPSSTDYGQSSTTSTLSGVGDVDGGYSTNTINEDWTLIENHIYFDRLGRRIPTHGDYSGSCGYVALAMLLVYLDTFHNGNTLTNDEWIDKGEALFDNYDETTNKIPIEDWEKVPGADQSLHTYLIEEHSSHIWWPFEGYPQTQSYLNNVFQSFKEANINNAYHDDYDVHRGTFTDVNGDTQNLIDEDIPVVLTLLEWRNIGEDEDEKKSGKLHNAIAYGYNVVNGDLYYLIHTGWRSQQVVIIHEASIYSYFAVEYTGDRGEDEYSSNVLVDIDGNTHYVDGSGIVWPDFDDGSSGGGGSSTPPGEGDDLPAFAPLSEQPEKLILE